MKDTSEYTGFLFEAQQLNSRADYSRKIRIKKQRNFKLPYQTAHAHTHLKQTRARENSSLKNWLKSENLTKKTNPFVVAYAFAKEWLCLFVSVYSSVFKEITIKVA